LYEDESACTTGQSNDFKNYFTPMINTNNRHRQKAAHVGSLETTAVYSLTADDFSEVKKLERLGQKTPWSDESLLSELTDANAFHFGIMTTNNRGLLAFALSRIVLDEIHIHHLCTHPDFRRNGLAKKLLGSVLGAACSKGVKKAFLEVAASNTAAFSLYKKMGFSVDFIREKYYSTGDDAFVMSRSLTGNERKGFDK
jgi:ribosomal-protein-alanine N-acetyltransferase